MKICECIISSKKICNILYNIIHIVASIYRFFLSTTDLIFKVDKYTLYKKKKKGRTRCLFAMKFHGERHLKRTSKCLKFCV